MGGGGQTWWEQESSYPNHVQSRAHVQIGFLHFYFTLQVALEKLSGSTERWFRKIFEKYEPICMEVTNIYI
jgi:hypothetical protein